MYRKSNSRCSTPGIVSKYNIRGRVSEGSFADPRGRVSEGSFDDEGRVRGGGFEGGGLTKALTNSFEVRAFN